MYVDDYCCGYDPWYAGTNVTAMDNVFGAGNWSDETYSTVNPAELSSSIVLALSGSMAEPITMWP